jgi:hypothetical protein
MSACGEIPEYYKISSGSIEKNDFQKQAIFFQMEPDIHLLEIKLKIINDPYYPEPCEQKQLKTSNIKSIF